MHPGIVNGFYYLLKQIKITEFKVFKCTYYVPWGEPWSELVNCEPHALWLSHRTIARDTRAGMASSLWLSKSPIINCEGDGTYINLLSGSLERSPESRKFGNSEIRKSGFFVNAITGSFPRDFYSRPPQSCIQCKIEKSRTTGTGRPDHYTNLRNEFIGHL